MMTVIIYQTTTWPYEKWTDITRIEKKEGWYLLYRGKKVARQCAVGSTIKLEVV